MSGFPLLLFLLTAREVAAQTDPPFRTRSPGCCTDSVVPARAPVCLVVKTGRPNGVKTGEIAVVLNRC